MADVDHVPDYSQKSIEELWAQWKVDHQKTYDTEEEEKNRLEIFKESKKRIEEHNEKYKKGETTFYMGLNQFADRKPHEVCRCMPNKHRCEKKD